MTGRNKLKRRVKKLRRRLKAGREKLSRLARRLAKLLRRAGVRAEPSAADWQKRPVPASLLRRVEKARKAGKYKQDNCSDCPFRLLRSGRARCWAELDKRKAKTNSCSNCPSRAVKAALEAASPR